MKYLLGVLPKIINLEKYQTENLKKKPILDTE